MRVMNENGTGVDRLLHRIACPQSFRQRDATLAETISVNPRPTTSFNLRLLSTVTAASLFTVSHGQRVTRATYDLVAYTRQVANTTASNENDRVFLQVVTFARNIHGNFFTVTQSHSGDFTKRRVRFLRRHRTNLQTNALLLRALLQNWRFAECSLLFAGFTDQLVDCWHQASIVEITASSGSLGSLAVIRDGRHRR